MLDLKEKNQNAEKRGGVQMRSFENYPKVKVVSINNFINIKAVPLIDHSISLSIFTFNVHS